MPELLLDILLYGLGILSSLIFSYEDIRERAITRWIIDLSLIIAFILRLLLVLSFWSHPNEFILNLFMGFASAVFFALVFGLYHHFQPQKLGLGDVKYMVLIALVLGTVASILGIFLGAIIALLSLILIPTLRKRESGIPFIPFLFLGSLVAIFLESSMNYFWSWIFSTLLLPQ